MKWRRVLVTGGAGYIGSALIRSLVDSAVGGSIRILDNLQNGGYPALMDLDPGGVEMVEGDILDPVAVRRALADVDAVVHLAGVLSTPLSFEHPRWMEQVNHWGTARLLESALEAGVERIVFASSYSVYGPGAESAERDACRPVGPYASSVLSAERAVAGAADRGLSTTVLRIGTVFGQAPVVRFDAMPNRFAYLAGTGRTLPIYGDGKQTRPLTHVGDACSAIAFCLARTEETAGGTYNVVTVNSSALDVANAAKRARPATRIHFTEQDVRAHLSFGMDGSRLRALGWQPAHTLDDGIGEVVERFTGVIPVGYAGGDNLRVQNAVNGEAYVE